MPPAAPAAPRRSDAREQPLTWGVALLTVAAPAAIGGAHPLTQVVLAAGALALLVAYVSLRGRRGLRPVPFAWAASLALGFTLLQLVPLPAGLVAIVSPHAYELRSDVVPGARWMPLSVDAPATWLACARAIGCLALLLLVGGFVRSRRHAERLLTIVAATAAGLAVVAGVQRLVGTQSILGLYRPRSQPGFGVFGTFVDVNHAASLLGLGALVAVGLSVDARGAKRSLFITFAALSTIALLFTTSRGGLVGFAVGGFVLASVLTARSVGVTRALVAASVLLVVGLTATLWANEGLRRRLSDGAALVHNQKTRGWADGMRVAAANRWVGVGRGAFEEAIGSYRANDEGIRLVYPENLVVHMASEWGIPFTLLLMAMVVATGARLAPAVARASPVLVGGACGVLAVVVHDMMDFSLELPGVAFPTMVTLATVVGRLAADRRQAAPRGYRLPLAMVAPLLAVALFVVAGAGVASAHSLDADFAQLRAAAESHSLDERALQTAIARHPGDDYLELLAAQQAYANKRPNALHHVNRALRLHPANWQAHRMAALLLLSMNRPAQAALEYRSALASGMGFDAGELVRMLRLHVVEAVPQTPERLMELARALYGSGLAAEADAAAERAVDLGGADEPLLMQRTKLALDANARAALAPAARALVAQAQSVDAFVLAARALARIGAHKEADAAVAAGLRAHPEDSALLLAGAELRLDADDLPGAREMLGRAAKSELTLVDRQRAEELSARVAERSGDVEGAILARARSRLIARQLRDMTVSGNGN